MCAPVALLAVAAATTAASGGYSAYNQYQQGAAQNKYYQAQADQARAEGVNALALADKQSNLIQNTAAQEGKQLKTQQAEFNATTNATLAANGVYGGTTAENIASSNFSKQQLDEMTLRFNADSKSWEAQTQGQYNKYAKDVQAGDLSYQGKLAKSTGAKNAFSTLLSTAAQTASLAATGGKK